MIKLKSKTTPERVDELISEFVVDGSGFSLLHCEGPVVALAQLLFDPATRTFGVFGSTYCVDCNLLLTNTPSPLYAARALKHHVVFHEVPSKQ